jgi:hypothetical protein
MKLAIATLVLTLGTVQALAQNRYPKPDDKEIAFNTQLDKTNVALEKFSDMACTDPTFDAASKGLQDAVVALHDIYEALPDNQDVLIKARETESFVGTIMLISQAEDHQQECLNPTDNKKVIAPPVPKKNNGV